MLRLVDRAAVAIATPRLSHRVAYLRRRIESLLLWDRRAPWVEVRPVLEQASEWGPFKFSGDPVLYLPSMYWRFAHLCWINLEFEHMVGLAESLISVLERLVPAAAARARAVAALERPPRFMERMHGELPYEVGREEYVKAQVAHGILAWCQANQWEAATALVVARGEPTNPDRNLPPLKLGRAEAELMGMPNKQFAMVEKDAELALRRLRKRRAEPGEPMKGGRPGHR